MIFRPKHPQIILDVHSYAKSEMLCPDELLGPDRRVEISAKRQKCWLHLRRLGHAQAAIARAFNRDSSNVRYGVDRASAAQ